ncbi:Uncharacterised protein [Klebsiella pneumoniae]|nr:Uncharacterised protein [Klebsiella pneumoniae]
MSEWCQNRFEITGKSVCIDVLLQWINGADTLRYRHATTVPGGGGLGY